MELISTILKIDLAVLTVFLGVLGFFFTALEAMKEDLKKEAEYRGRADKAIEFHGQRLDSLENWRAAISEIRRSQ